jgi:N-carbamoyl-L-amino-acid hydrolase
MSSTALNPAKRFNMLTLDQTLDNTVDKALAVCRAVSSSRLNTWISALATIGGRDDGGVARETLTQEDWQARRWLINLAKELGCRVYQDQCANLYFERAGSQNVPAVLTGSHLDTQPIGGKYDGAYGVLAGLEIIAALNDANIATDKPITVVSWTNEEGSRFGPGAMGSNFFANPECIEQHKKSIDPRGISFATALQDTLTTFADIEFISAPPTIANYIELHIEQGPVLENAGTSLGVVTSIQAVRWYRIHCQGTMAHAGTTPMNQRQDAMHTAINLASYLYGVAEPFIESGLKFTIGNWNVHPNAINTIAGEVNFSCDIRAQDETLVEEFSLLLSGLCEAFNDIRCECVFTRGTTHFPLAITKIIEQACEQAEQNLAIAAAIKLPSGAFHDAMYIADCVDTGMIFVPSHLGVSHNAREYTSPEDLYRGAWALTHAVTTLALS